MELQGELPSEAGLLTAVKELSLDTNQLYGSLPSEIAQLTALHSLYLSKNAISGGFMVSEVSPT